MPRLLHHRRAVHAQQHLERSPAAPRAGCRPSCGCVTVPPTDGVDRVRLVEDVAEDVADDLAQVGAFEIEHDAVAGRLHRGRRRQAAARLLALHHHAGALEDARLVLGRRQPGLQRALGGVGERRRHRFRAFHRRRAHCDGGASASDAGCEAQATSTSGSAQTSAPRKRGGRVIVVIRLARKADAVIAARSAVRGC